MSDSSVSQSPPPVSGQQRMVVEAGGGRDQWAGCAAGQGGSAIWLWCRRRTPLDFGAAEERGGSSVAERGGWAEWRGKGRRLCLEGRAAWPRQPAAASAWPGAGPQVRYTKGRGAAGGAGGRGPRRAVGFAPGLSAPHDWAVERGRRREVWGPRTARRAGR